MPIFLWSVVVNHSKIVVRYGRATSAGSSRSGKIGSGSAVAIPSLPRYDGAAHDRMDVTTEEVGARVERLVGLIGAVAGAGEDVAAEEVGLRPFVGVDGDVVRHP